MGATDFILAGTPILLSLAIPGILTSLALLNKTRLSFIEKIWFGVILGIIIPPSVSFLANMAGIPYSLNLALASIALSTIAGIALCWREKVHLPKPVFSRQELEKHWIDLLVSLIVILAFYIRIQSLSPVFYEFDPYWYMMQGQFLLTQGSVPAIGDWAFYPLPDTHRTVALTAHLESMWYSIYTQGGAYNNLLFSVVANVYPPLVGALMCFLAFILISQEHKREIGLVAAGLVAFGPRLIEKFFAGEAEIQPWGLFAALFFWAAYAMAMKYQSRRYSILAAIALSSVTLGSSANILAYLVMAGYIGVQSLIDFLRKQSSLRFIELNAIVLCGSLAFIPLVAYTAPFSGLSIPKDPFAVVAALAFAGALYYLSVKVKHFEQRLNYLFGLLLLAVIFLAVTPLGQPLLNYVKSAASIAAPSSPLFQTVAEENPTGNDFADALGYLGREYPLLDWVAIAISTVTLFLLRLAAELLGVPALQAQPNGSLFWVILALSAISSLYATWKGSRLGILWLLIIFPITFVGLGKVKHVLQLSLVAILGFVAFLGEAFNFASERLSGVSKEDALRAAAGFGTVFVLLNFTLAASIFPASVSYYLSGKDVGSFCSELSDQGNVFAMHVYCTRIPDYWLNAMAWIKANVGDDERVLHWWDYGHWTNFFGEKKVITRNDHKYPEQDLEVANAMVAEESPHLAKWMSDHKAKYFLVDVDLINKWGALVYLSCTYNNETTYANGPGNSDCDRVYQWERVFVPQEPNINEYCQLEGKSLLRAYSTLGMTYCINVLQTQSGQMPVMYYENGTVNRGVLVGAGATAIRSRAYSQFIVWYPETWLDGQSGLPDAKGKGYDSNFYKAFFLGNLSGFTQVYPDYNTPGPNIPIRIFKMNG